MWKVNGRQTTDTKWWQKLTLPVARWANKWFLTRSGGLNCWNLDIFQGRKVKGQNLGNCHFQHVCKEIHAIVISEFFKSTKMLLEGCVHSKVWTFQLYVATIHQHLHMEYTSQLIQYSWTCSSYHFLDRKLLEYISTVPRVPSGQVITSEVLRSPPWIG